MIYLSAHVFLNSIKVRSGSRINSWTFSSGSGLSSIYHS